MINPRSLENRPSVLHVHVEKAALSAKDQLSTMQPDQQDRDHRNSDQDRHSTDRDSQHSFMKQPESELSAEQLSKRNSPATEVADSSHVDNNSAYSRNQSSSPESASQVDTREGKEDPRIHEDIMRSSPPEPAQSESLNESVSTSDRKNGGKISPRAALETTVPSDQLGLATYSNRNSPGEDRLGEKEQTETKAIDKPAVQTIDAAVEWPSPGYQEKDSSSVTVKDGGSDKMDTDGRVRAGANISVQIQRPQSTQQRIRHRQELSKDSPFLNMDYQEVAAIRTDLPDLPSRTDGRAAHVGPSWISSHPCLARRLLKGSCQTCAASGDGADSDGDPYAVPDEGICTCSSTDIICLRTFGPLQRVQEMGSSGGSCSLCEAAVAKKRDCP